MSADISTPTTPYGDNHPTALPTAPVERELVHQRRINVNGFVRSDGQYDIEAELTDHKTYSFPSDFRGTVTPDLPVHHMILRITMTHERIITAAEAAVEHGAALITVPSTGGARMQEGVLSLMQLPRTILAVEKVRNAGLPHIVLLAHPTTGGVTASFAMLGDLQIAEPGAIIGFAGRRVIEETVREKLPEDFQTAEYLQDHGMVDSVVPRAEQPEFLGRVLGFLMGQHKATRAA